MTEVICTAAAVILLAVNAVQDIRKREIFLMFTVVMAAAGAVFSLVSGSAGPAELLLSALPGVFLAAFSFLSDGGAGMGDAIVLAALGTWEGPQDVWTVFMISLLFSSAAAVILIVKGKSRAGIPFVPFVLAGYLAMLFLF